MKRIFLLFLVLGSFSAIAQEFKPFKVNVSLGYAKAIGEGVSGGRLLSIEPKYGLSDHFDLGLRLEAALIARGLTKDGNTTTSNIVLFSSSLVTGTYLFGTGRIRPFIGIGAGIFNLASGGTVTIINNQQPQDVTFVNEAKFGAMVRAGIKIGHFGIGVEYNAIPTTSNKLANTTIDSKNAYLGIKVGVDIGGGRK